jgi:hypothetical protein
MLVAFLVQQIILWRWESKWSRIEPKVTELTAIRDQIRQYRPWYDESVRTLSILKKITEAFPENGDVSAKTVELRAPATVTCTGTARSRDALIKALDRLGAATNEVAEVRIEGMRGSTTLEYTFNFQWIGGGRQ